MAEQNPLCGAYGGWWSYSTILLPGAGTLCVGRVEVADTFAEPGAFVAEWRVVPGASVHTGVFTSIAYDVRLRYQGVSGVVELLVDTPVADPALGCVGTEARDVFSQAWRWALVFQCSTWDPGTSTYAADGFVKLFLNGSSTPLLAATAVTIPRRLNGQQIRWTVSPNGDCDRVWARTRPVVLPTTGGGAVSGATPTDLLWFDDFSAGYPSWTAVELYVPPGSFVFTPHTWPDCGGDGGAGISIYASGPHDAVGLPGVVNHTYSGLWRILTYPDDAPGGGDGDGEGGGGDGDGDAPTVPEVAPSYHTDTRYIRRLRRAPHVAQENRRTFVKTFELDLERGQGLETGQGEAPVVLLRVSRDGGQTWGEELRMAAPRLGDYLARVKAERLGQGRDLVFEVTVSDPIAWSLVGAWLELEGGTS